MYSDLAALGRLHHQGAVDEPPCFTYVLRPNGTLALGTSYLPDEERIFHFQRAVLMQQAMPSGNEDEDGPEIFARLGLLYVLGAQTCHLQNKVSIAFQHGEYLLCVATYLTSP